MTWQINWLYTSYSELSWARLKGLKGSLIAWAALGRFVHLGHLSSSAQRSVGI